MARARDPTTGIMPMADPREAFLPPSFIHAEKAVTGPPPVCRPSAISPITPVEAIRATKIK